MSMPLFFEPFDHLIDFELDDTGQIFLGQIPEHAMISSIRFKKFRLKGFFDLVEQAFFGPHCKWYLLFWAIKPKDPELRIYMLRPQIGGHDNDGITKIHLAAQTVGQLPVFKNLQEQIKDIRMGFFDLIQ